MIRIVLRRNRGENSDSEEDEELLQHQDTSTSDEDEQEEERENDESKPQKKSKKDKKKQREPYDKSLPAQHLYLGEMEEEGVASVQEEETTSTLPLLCVPERVLFPGETLPMHIHNPHEISLLRKAFADHKPVAVCTDLRGYSAHGEVCRPSVEELSIVGTTADIIACKQEEEGSYWFYGPRFIVKLFGRQRFQVMEIYKRTTGMMDCQIRILPEVLMTPQPTLVSCPPCVRAGHVSSLVYSHQPEATLVSHKRALKSRNYLWSPSSRTALCSAPGWVLRMYDFDHLRERVLEQQHMQTITNNDDKAVLPADVVSLSYWLARRLPVDDTTKLELLKMNCPTMRIMQGLRMLNQFTDLYCERCETVIAKKEHIFSMSVDGPLAAYVNPGGVVHDTLTVLEATNLKKVGRGTTEDSWFPGYQWTIVYCKQCHDHKGWLFDAVKKNLSPKSFFGLRRPSLSLFKKPKTPDSHVTFHMC